MKTKLFFLKIISLGLIVTSCSSLPKNKTKIIIETSFEPRSIEKKIDNDLSLTIEPINADGINNEILNSLSFDGSYYFETDYEYFGYLNGQEKLSNSEKKQKESLIKIFEQIDQLRNNDQLTFNQSVLFKEKTYTHFILKEVNGQYGEVEPDFTNLYNKSMSEKINPFFSGNKHFSVFKLTLKNNKKEIQDVKIEDFQVFSEGELLYPFKNSYFESAFKKKELNENPQDQNKLKTIYRMNMPDNIRLLNNQPIVKYFSTPALNDENKNLTINYINENKVHDFNFDVNTKKQIMQVQLFEHKIKFKKVNGHPDFNIIQLNEVDYLLKKNLFYLEKNNDKMMLLSLDVDFYNAKIKLTTTNFSTNNLTKNTIVVDNKK